MVADDAYLVILVQKVKGENDHEFQTLNSLATRELTTNGAVLKK